MMSNQPHVLYKDKGKLITSKLDMTNVSARATNNPIPPHHHDGNPAEQQVSDPATRDSDEDLLGRHHRSTEQVCGLQLAIQQQAKGKEGDRMTKELARPSLYLPPDIQGDHWARLQRARLRFLIPGFGRAVRKDPMVPEKDWT